MTRMLASVTGPEEAEIALAGGADIIDLKDPAARRVRRGRSAHGRATPCRAIAGRRPVSAVTGDSADAAGARCARRREAMAETGVDYVKHGHLRRAATPPAASQALAPLAARAHG